jgi:hypothetical protein
MKIMIQGQTLNMDAETKFSYTWRRDGEQRVLTCDSLAVKVTLNGQVTQDSTMSRDRFTEKGGATKLDVSREDAAPQLREMLEDSFDKPLCTIVVDKDGKELKRAVTAGPGAKALIDNGMIANARLFHVPFPAGADKWQWSNEVSMGNGGFARGNLTYEKTKPADKNDPLVKVQVAGELTNEEFQAAGGVRIKNAKYQTSGEQSCDRAEKDWSTG